MGNESTFFFLSDFICVVCIHFKSLYACTYLPPCYLLLLVGGRRLVKGKALLISF